MTLGSPSDFTADYFPLPDDDGAHPSLLTPFRDEVVHSTSERILFDEEMTVPSHDFRSPRPVYTERRAQLNGLNFLNLVTYAFHLFVSWGIGVWGLDGILETRWEISAKYDMLVTPAMWTYYIWYPILVLEGVFAVAQLLPAYRARPIVQAGTGFYFFYTFLIQTAWTLFFAFQLFICSFIAVVAALLSLASLLRSQHVSMVGMDRSRKMLEYYLFRFPFNLHTGWMSVVTAHHFSLMFRSYNAPLSIQVAVDIVSLGVLLPVAIVFLVSPWKDFVIPVVILWAFIGIGCRLLHPSDALVELNGVVIIEALRYASFFFAGTITCCLLPIIVIWFAREFCTINVVELEE